MIAMSCEWCHAIGRGLIGSSKATIGTIRLSPIVKILDVGGTELLECCVIADCNSVEDLYYVVGCLLSFGSEFALIARGEAMSYNEPISVAQEEKYGLLDELTVAPDETFDPAKEKPIPTGESVLLCGPCYRLKNMVEEDV